jgi:hypothetical protein
MSLLTMTYEHIITYSSLIISGELWLYGQSFFFILSCVLFLVTNRVYSRVSLFFASSIFFFFFYYFLFLIKNYLPCMCNDQMTQLISRMSLLISHVIISPTIISGFPPWGCGGRRGVNRALPLESNQHRASSQKARSSEQHEGESVALPCRKNCNQYLICVQLSK